MKRESAELYPMLDLEEALARVLAAFEPLEPEQVPIVEALGQVLAEDVFAEMDIPPLANTAMDGYAVRCDDTGGARHDHPRRLRVAADLAAGHVLEEPIRPGTAVRIMTGAPVPPGAEAVVPFEEVERDGDEILVFKRYPHNKNIRAAGGTLARYAAEGVRVVVVSATRGEAGIRGVDAGQAAGLREAELRQAASELGVDRVCVLGHPDGGLADVDPGGALSRLMALLRELRPQVVITFGPDGISGHPDHVTVSRWATAAFDALDGPEAPQRLYYVAPSLATQQGCGVADPPPLPTDAIGVDVEPYLETKVRAMQAHASQDPPYPGDPAKEAEQMACHEWFVLARPRLPPPSEEDDLFGQLVD